jgi:beta-N-acetylhexosaminidase
MTSHILVQQLDRKHPATMSRIVLHDLLRRELGFSGVVVSDALDMAGASGSLGMAGAAVAALRAGCDLLCLGTENTETQLADIERTVSSAVADGTLAANRVREATSRVRGLATDLEAARQSAGQPPDSPRRWSKGEAELVRTFDIQPWAADWRGKASGRYTVVRLEASPNIAVGATPWGPFALEVKEGSAANRAASAATAFTGQRVWLMAPKRTALPPFQPDQPVLVVGRDIHQHPFARDAVDRLRSQHADVLVVDVGWPSADRRYADVATFGASRLMGRALLSWLAIGGAPGE